MATAGRILIIPRGDYNENTTYEMLDLVNFIGVTWLAKKTVTGIEPSEANSEYWFKFHGNSVANNLTTEVSGYVLDARQGKALMDKINQLSSEIEDLKESSGETKTYGYFGKELEFTWAEIKAKTEVGDFSGIGIGDYKDITLSNGEVVRMEVAGIDTYIGNQSSNNHRIYWISRDCLETTYPMNTSLTNTGGFPASTLKTTLNSTIFEMLPSEVQEVIVADKRLCSTKGSWAWQSDQRLWLPSEVEVWGHNARSELFFGNGCGMQFPIFAESLRHILKGIGFGASAIGNHYSWWCDSPHSESQTTFCLVEGTGFPADSRPDTALGVPICFTT